MAAAAGPVLWMDIKEAGKIMPAVQIFDMAMICSYLMEQHSDFRSIRESSYQMFY